MTGHERTTTMDNYLATTTAAVNAVLANEGADNEGGWHSWRCFDKSRYPEDCTCTYDVAAAVTAVAFRHIRESLAQRTEARFDTGPLSDEVDTNDAIAVGVAAAFRAGQRHAMSMLRGLS